MMSIVPAVMNDKTSQTLLTTRQGRSMTCVSPFFHGIHTLYFSVCSQLLQAV